MSLANEYYETYRPQIALYESAERYLKNVLQGHFDAKKLPPITKWKAECDKLTAERNRLNREYVSLKNDTAAVEKIRSNVYDIISEERRRTQPQRTQDMER